MYPTAFPNNIPSALSSKHLASGSGQIRRLEALLPRESPTKDGILGLVVANEHSMQRLAPTILFSMNAMMKKKSQRAIRIGTGYSRDEPSVVRLHHSKGIVWISSPKEERNGTSK